MFRLVFIGQEFAQQNKSKEKAYTMKIETRRNRVSNWKPAADCLILHYFDTTDVAEIKKLFGSKRVLKRMDMEFRIVKEV